MSIFDDINVLRAHVTLSKAFSTPDVIEATKSIHNAMERVAQYAHDCAVKDMAESGMETLTKIMKGDKIQ